MSIINRLLLFTAAVAALTLPPSSIHSKLLTIELAPGETRKVTEAEKLTQKDEGVDFIDITDWPDTARLLAKPKLVSYPATMRKNETVAKINAELNSTNIEQNLQLFSSFSNRYYQSETGNQSAEWLLVQARSYVPVTSPVTVSIFQHRYRQSSIIARIPGKNGKTIVVGAHQDSINGSGGGNRTTAEAPGADDNGSGSMTILEAFRALLLDDTIATGQAEQTIEFHWYAAEEVGLLGSGNVFWSYIDEGRDIAAMLNQDMTGYTAGYTSHNMTPKFGLVTDNVDAPLTAFTRRIIDAYTDPEAGDTECGYACSDHVSATRVGYPGAFVFEGEMHTVNDNPYVHSEEDTIVKVAFTHMLEHVRLVVGWVVELVFAEL